LGGLLLRRDSEIDHRLRTHCRKNSAADRARAGDVAAPNGAYPPPGGAIQPGMPLNLAAGKASQARSSS
jgi:hypothetical protein